MQTVSSKTLEDIPVALTEFNCRGPYTTNMVDGMFVTQILGEVIKNNIGLATMWVSEWKWSPDQEPKSFLAVQDPDQDDYTPRPVYMPFYYYGKCFGDHMLKCQSSGSGINAYASRFSSGEIGVAVVNTSGSNQVVQIDLQNLADSIADKIDWYEVYANSIEPGDKKFYINEQSGVTAGGGPEEYHKVPPYRSSVEEDIRLDLPAYSINFVVISIKKKPVNVPDVRSSPTVMIFPNPALNRLEIKSDENYASFRIYTDSGMLVLSGKDPGPYIDIEKIYAGHYILQLQNKHRVDTLRFFKL
jgi:hypothetical protein